MKKLKYVICLAIAAASLLFPSAALASDGAVPLLDDQVVFGGTFTLDAGDEIDGSLIVVGGVVTLEPGSVVTKDILVFGGNVTIEGKVKQSLVAFGGLVVLTESAEIYGDLIAPSTVVRRSDEAQIYGQIIADPEALDLDIPEIDMPDIPDLPRVVNPTFFERISNTFFGTVEPLTNFVWSLVSSFGVAAVAVLVLMLLPKQTERMTEAVGGNPVSTGGLGLLTVVISVMAMVITAITLILIPATVLIVILLALGLFFGYVAVGSELGRRFSSSFGYQWRSPLQTAIGTFTIAFLIGLFNLAHWDGLAILIRVVVGAIGLGAVVLTRFGTRQYLKRRPSMMTVPSADIDIKPMAGETVDEEAISEVSDLEDVLGDNIGED